MRHGPTVLFAAALLLAGCVAHFPRPDEPTAFREPSYAGIAPGAGQIFDAEPAIHVYFLNGLEDAEVQAKGGFALTSSFSFLAHVRMLDEPSTPVRTPSYEPRFMLQLLQLTAPRPSPLGLHRLLGGVELAAAHYSNGQKGCALADHLRGTGDSDFDCTPVTTPPSTALNTQDGSFTTNYLGLGLRGRWISFPQPGGPSSWTATLGAGAQWHLPCGFSGCMDPPMRERYGEWVGSWRVEGDLAVLRGIQYRLPLFGSRVLGARVRGIARGDVHFPSKADPFGDVTLEAILVLRDARGFGFGPYVRLHRGSDPLNIRFEERFDFWSFGLFIDPAPPEEIRTLADRDVLPPPGSGTLAGVEK